MMQAAKNKVKKKLKRIFLFNVLPLLLLVILVAAFVTMLLEIPKQIDEALSNYFGEMFDSVAYENLSLTELRDFFLSEPDLKGLEELQSSLMLANYIDLSLSSTLIKKDSEKEYLVYEDNNVPRVDMQDYTVNYEDLSSIYAIPWQLFAAVDVINMNFGIEEFSDDVRLTNDKLRPLFDGKINVDYEPTIYKSTTVRKTIVETTTTYTEEIMEIEIPFSDKKINVPYKKKHKTSDTWTETVVERLPTTLFNTTTYYNASYINEIEYEQDVDKSKDKYTVTDNEEIKVVREVTTTITTKTPKYKKQDYQNNHYFRDAILLLIRVQDRDLFMEIVKTYPYTANLQLAAANAFDAGSYYITDDYGPTTHDFVYPRLKRSTDGKYHRVDIINLAKSLEGLDYFWGGKYNKVGYKSNWGSLREVTSTGTSMTGLLLRDGLDCSGFVQWVYKNAGLSIEAGTSTMLSGNQLDEISLDQMLPGDLGFYHNYSNGETGNHVGIYLGYIDGKHLFIHAQGAPGAADEFHTTGQVVISALNEKHNDFPPVRFAKFYRYNAETLQ
ncbi:MAG: C40 family peptidase [Clostridiales bacterium]|nr:C40 family peptidase [Clostridiales bacterium]